MGGGPWPISSRRLPWLLMVGTLVAALATEPCCARDRSQPGLARSASVAVPLYQGATVSLTTLSGGLAFHEFGGLQPLQAVGYAIGLLVATGGLLALARGEEPEEADDADPEAVDAVDAWPAEELSLDQVIGTSQSTSLREEAAQGELRHSGVQTQSLLAASRRRSARRSSVVNRLVAPPGFMLNLATPAVSDPTPQQRPRSKSLTSYAPPPFLNASGTDHSPAPKLRPRSMTTAR